MESTDSSSGCQQLQLPPGFRFHPTDEELVVHYLKRKAASTPLPVAIIAEIDLYKFDPWELPGKANFGEHEWYFFSPRDRKYPNGARPNRAATSGYWKATGTDKPILTSSASAGGGVVGGGSAGSNHHQMKVGVKKALVFYGGKPPKGIKTNWIMHEYRLTDTTTTSKPPQHGRHDSTNGKKASLRLDDWVLCRIYKKNSSSTISNCTSTQMRVVMGREGDVEPSMDHHQSNNNNMLSAAAPACVSLPIHHPPAGTVGISRHTTTGTCKYTTLLENDDTFFQGLLSTNTSTHGNADDDDDVQDGIVHATSTTTIQLGTSAAAANTQSSKAEPHCLVSPTFQGNKLPQATSPYGWYVNASTGTIDLNPQLPPSKRFHAYNGGGGGAGSSNSNNSTTNVTNNNINSSGTNSNNTDDGAGHNTIETMLHQQSIPVHGSTVPPNFVSHHLRRRRQENNSLGSLLLHGDGTSGSILGQAYQQPTIWRSS